MRNTFINSDPTNTRVQKQEFSLQNSVNTLPLNENKDSPLRFLNINSLKPSQKRQSDIIYTSQTVQMSNDKYQNKINSNVNQIRENILQARDVSNKIIINRDQSDPTCGSRNDLNKTLPKLNQNSEIQYNVSLQIQERQNMNQKLYKVSNLQKQQSPNQQLNYIFINDESKNNPQKESQFKNNINEFRNSFNINQRAKTNTVYEPISSFYKDLNDSKGEILQNDFKKIYLYDLSKQKIIESDVKEQNEKQFTMKNNFKPPQFQSLANYQKVYEQKQQSNQGYNMKDDLQKISELLNNNPLQSLHKNQGIKEDNKTNIQSSKESNLQIIRNQIGYFSNQKNQVDKQQQNQQQVNQNYEPHEDQSQLYKSKKHFRILSGCRQKRTNSNLNLSQQIPLQNSIQLQEQKNIRTSQDNSFIKDSQVLVIKNIFNLERNILNEGDQIIQKINLIPNVSQLQTKQQNSKSNSALNNKNGKIILQFNRQSSKNKWTIESKEKQDKSICNQSVDNQKEDKQSDLQNLNETKINSNSFLDESKRNSRKINSYIGSGEFDQYNEEIEKQRSQLNSTDTPLTNSDRMSQNTDKKKVQNIQQEQSTKNESQLIFQNILSDESSVQDDSQDETLSDSEQNQGKISFKNKNQQVQSIDQLNLYDYDSQEFEKSLGQQQVKSQTQQLPRSKKEQKFNENMSDFSFLLNQVKRSKNQQNQDIKKQFTITFKEAMHSQERNNTSKPSNRNSSQIKQQVKSQNNLDNNPDEKGDISTSKIQQKKEGKIKNFKAPPEVSSKCWSILNADQNEQLYGKNSNLQVEIASLTKIMTCYVTIFFLEENKLELKKVFIEVSKIATKVGGTSANLVKGDFVSIYELLYGLMLPSGNDAAVVLSEGIGYLLLRKQSQLPFTSEYSQSNIPGDENIYIDFKCKQEVGGLNVCTASFLKEMNKYAKINGLQKTNYACVHGLSNKQNTSTAKDVGLLSCIAMKHPLFQKVVNTQEYETIDALDNNKKNQDQYEWENTNQMLEYKGYDGVKTGVTDSAGPCLSSHYRKNRNGQQIKLVCILLNCKSMNHRWTETKKLISWSLKCFYPKKSKKSQDESIQQVQPLSK